MRAVWSLAKSTISRWFAHDPGMMGAALAYYAVFSIGPILLIIVSVAGMVLGTDAARAELVQRIQQTAGEDVAGMATRMLAAAGNFGAGIVGATIAIVTLLVSAIGTAAYLRSTLNRMWDVEPPASGFGVIVRQYASAAMGIVGAGLLFLAIVVASSALTTFADRVSAIANPFWIAMINNAVSLALSTLVFAALFKWMSDAEIAWPDAIAGAVVTGVLFLVGKATITWYLGTFAFGSVYGASASIAILLFWVYYSSQIVFLGAAFVRSWSERGAVASAPSGRT